MTKGKLRKMGLIKKGAPHPNHPSFKFDSAHLTEKEAEKREDKLIDDLRVVDIRRTSIPKQELVYAKRKPVRITPRRPKLRR